MHTSELTFETHLDVSDDSADAVSLLASRTNLPKNAIKHAMQKGAVWLERGKQLKRIRRTKISLRVHDQLHFYYNERVLNQQPHPAKLIADEGSYSIWFKPYGMLSQGSKWGDHCTIYRWVEQHLNPQRPAFIVHRLDRAASGLMILAHQKRTAVYFSALFQKRKVEKKYRAIVSGEFPSEATIKMPIDHKPAVSHVKRLSYANLSDQSLLEVNIETGRKHQIRRHLSEYGFPIVGDRLYGGAGVDDENNLQLVSCYLKFDPPDNQSPKEYVLPDEFRLRV
ncbi:MAG: RNA pseudouridine synthase [Pseudomonadota bacterium]